MVRIIPGVSARTFAAAAVMCVAVVLGLPFSSAAGLLTSLFPSSTPTPRRISSAAQPTPTDEISADGYKTITKCGNVFQSVRLGADLSNPEGGCLIVRAGDLTIDGNGFRIDAATMAIQVLGHPDVTIQNVRGTGAVQIYGEEADRNVIEDSDVGSISIYMGDDNVVRNNTMGTLKISGLYDQPPQRALVAGNTITGDASRLVYISPGGDGDVSCVRSDITFEDNDIVSTVTDPGYYGVYDVVLFYLRCGTHNSVIGNRMHGPGKALGIFLRDEADDNLIENNYVWVAQGSRGAFHISSGNVDKHHPRRNVVQYNYFRANATRSIWIQARDTESNTFFHNLFMGHGPESARVRGGVNNVFDHNTFVRLNSGNLLVLENFLSPGNTYTNNIFLSGGASVFELSSIFEFSGYSGEGNLFFNWFWQPAVFDGAHDLGWWRDQTGADLRSIEADPRFVNEPLGNLRLRKDSPARKLATDGTDAGACSDESPDLVCNLAQ